MTNSEEKTLDAIISSWNVLDEMAMTELGNGNDNFKLSVGPWTVKLQLGEDKPDERNPNHYDPDLPEEELKLRDELKIFLYEDIYKLSYCPDAPDIVLIDVYDVPDEHCKKLNDDLLNIIRGFDEGKMNNVYIPHVVPHTKTLKYYPDLATYC